ncbi:MAG TPA: hypothetical protein DGT21_17670, partial [Armatimonadetes bacterium]|nr:hypothetical protein [Armatimonadota bacterium]
MRHEWLRTGIERHTGEGEAEPEVPRVEADAPELARRVDGHRVRPQLPARDIASAVGERVREGNFALPLGITEFDTEALDVINTQGGVRDATAPLDWGSVEREQEKRLARAGVHIHAQRIVARDGADVVAVHLLPEELDALAEPGRI